MRQVRTSKARVLRLMRAAGLLAPTRVGHAHGPAAHDGTILTERPDEMWGSCDEPRMTQDVDILSSNARALPRTPRRARDGD